MRFLANLILVFVLMWAPWIGAQVSLDYMPRESGDIVSLQYLVDAEGGLSIEEIQALGAAAWKNCPPGGAVFGFTDNRYWFTGRQTKVSNDASRQYIEIANPLLDRIDLFVEVKVPGGNVVRHQYRLGDMLPFDARPIRHPNFVVPIDLPMNATFTFYARVETSSSMQVPIKIWGESDFHAHNDLFNIANGVYIGSLVALLIYHLALLVMFREPLYLYFSLFGLCLGTLSLCFNGLAFEFLWPSFIEWNEHALVVCAMLTAGFWLTYAIEFIAPPKMGATPCARLQQLTLIVTLLMLAASFLLPYRISIHLAIAMVLLALILSVYCGYNAMRRGIKQAGFLIGAVLMLLAAGVTYLMAKFAILPSSIYFDGALQSIFLVEFVTLSIGLSARFLVERNERVKVSQQLAAFQELSRKQLEAHVTDRTYQLEESNRKLSQLSVTDGLTGLFNRRYLDTSLELEVGRAILAAKPLALAMVDIDRFKMLNDTYGHAAGDTCLREVAKELQKQVPRSSDWVARYGGEEFCVIMPNTDANGAMVVAERIRRSMLGLRIDVGQELLGVTVSVGVCCGVPRHSSSLQRMQEEVDQALYRAKQSGRNKVVMSPWPSEST